MILVDILLDGLFAAVAGAVWDSELFQILLCGLSAILPY